MNISSTEIKGDQKVPTISETFETKVNIHREVFQKNLEIEFLIGLLLLIVISFLFFYFFLPRFF